MNDPPKMVHKCGKSTLTENLGAALAYCGAKVLLVDQDPSGNFSIALGLPKNSRNTIESLMRSVILEDTLDFEETVVHHGYPSGEPASHGDGTSASNLGRQQVQYA